jgi:hypothetical protein
MQGFFYFHGKDLRILSMSARDFVNFLSVISVVFDSRDVPILAVIFLFRKREDPAARQKHYNQPGANVPKSVPFSLFNKRKFFGTVCKKAKKITEALRSSSENQRPNILRKPFPSSLVGIFLHLAAKRKSIFPNLPPPWEVVT